MFEFVARCNPLRKSPAFKRIEAMEAKINAKEQQKLDLDTQIDEGSTYVRERARELEKTAEEALMCFDNVRGK